MQVKSVQVAKVLVLFEVSTDPIPDIVPTFDDLWESFPWMPMEDIENHVEEELVHMIPWHCQLICA